MHPSDITVEVRDRHLQRVAVIPPEVLDLTITDHFNDAGGCWVTLPAEHEAVAPLREAGAGLIVTGPDGLVLFSGSIVGENTRSRASNPEGTTVFTASSDTAVLQHRLVWPDPLNPEVENRTRSFDKRQGSRESLMHQYVGVNLGPGALSSRRDYRLTMGPNLNRGDEVRYSGNWEPLGTALYEIAGTSTIGFRITQRDSALRFETYEARDLRKHVRLDVEGDTLEEDEFGIYTPTASRVIVIGDGQGMERREVVEVTTDATPDVESVHGRIEQLLPRQNSRDRAELGELGEEFLAAEAVDSIAIRVVPTDDLVGMEYGRDYYLGDRITVVVGDDEHDDVIAGTTIRIDSEGVRCGLVIGLIESRRTASRDLERRVSKLERNAPNIDVEELADEIETRVGDKREPAAPTNLTGVSVAQLDPSGQPRTRVLLDWDAVTKATDLDGAGPIDVRGYVIHQRSGDAVRPTWVDVSTTAEVSVELADWFTPNTTWEFAVSAVSRDRVTGPMSDYITMTMEDDYTAPPPPSKAVITYDKGAAIANWDGLTGSGTDMPPDFSHIRVSVSTSAFPPALDAPHWTVRYGAGSFLLPIEPLDTTRYVHFQAMDYSGNRSDWSSFAAFRTVQYVVGETEIRDDSITTPKVRANSITAMHLESVLSISNLFVAGEVNGAAAELDHSGLKVWTVNDAGNRHPYPLLNLGADGDNALAISSGEAPDAVASISASGAVSGASLSVASDPEFGGQLLMGAWANRGTDVTGDRNSILWDMPWGAWGDGVDVWGLASHLDAPSGTEQMLAYGTWNLLEGRFYRVTLVNPALSFNDMGGSTASGFIRMYKTHAMGLDKTPAVPSTSDIVVARSRIFWPASTTSGSYSGVSDLTALVRPSGGDITQNFAVSIAGSNSRVSLSNTMGYNWKLIVEDIGPAPEYLNGRAYGATTPPPVTKKTYYFNPASVNQRQGSLPSYFTWSGVRQDDKAIQGGNHTTEGVAAFHTNVRFGTSRSLSGSSQTNITLAQAVAGATKVRARLRTTAAWMERSSVRARIGWGQSDSSSPTTQVMSQPIGRGGTTTTDLGTSGGDYIKNNASGDDIRIFIGPGTNLSNADLMALYAMSGSSSQKMQLQVDVWK